MSLSSSSNQDAVQRVNGILRRMHGRYFRGAAKCDVTGHPVEWRTPLDEVMEREEAELREAHETVVECVADMVGVDRLPDWLEDRILETVFERFQSIEKDWLGWFFEGGPHPIHVLRRLVLYAKVKKPDLIWNASFRDLGDLFNETHAAMHALCKKLFQDVPAPWKKMPESCRRMADAQRGNTNRRGGYSTPFSPLHGGSSTPVSPLRGGAGDASAGDAAPNALGGTEKKNQNTHN